MSTKGLFENVFQQLRRLRAVTEAQKARLDALECPEPAPERLNEDGTICLDRIKPEPDKWNESLWITIDDKIYVRNKYGNWQAAKELCVVKPAPRFKKQCDLCDTLIPFEDKMWVFNTPTYNGTKHMCESCVNTVLRITAENGLVAKPTPKPFDTHRLCRVCGREVPEGETLGWIETESGNRNMCVTCLWKASRVYANTQRLSCVFCGKTSERPSSTGWSRVVQGKIVCNECCENINRDKPKPTPRQELAEKVLHEILRYHSPYIDTEASYFQNAEWLRVLASELEKAKEFSESILVPTLDRIATLIVQAAVEADAKQENS